MSILQPTINDARSKAFESVANQLTEIDLEVLKVYFPQSVAAGALPHLAEQFNVAGIRGWNLAETEQEKRDLIEEAILLHRTAGTPYAIKRVLTLVGFPNATIVENPPLTFDGSWTFNSEEYFEGIKTYGFVVFLSSDRPVVSVTQRDFVEKLIREWKPARSHLLDLRIGTPPNDISLYTNLLQYDGLWSYGGDQEYDGERNI